MHNIWQYKDSPNPTSLILQYAAHGFLFISMELCVVEVSVLQIKL